MEYRISSNNSRGQFFLFSYKKGAIIGRRRLFKILLTGSRALNIMLYFPIKSKNNHVNILMGSWLNMGFFQSIPSLVPWLIFRAWIFTDQFCWVSLHFNLTGGIKGREDGERGRGGTIIRGRRFIRGDIWSARQQVTYKKLEIYARDWE